MNVNEVFGDDNTFALKEAYFEFVWGDDNNVFEELLKTPKIDIDLLLHSIANDSKTFCSKAISVINLYHPDAVQNWLKRYPEMYIAQLICTEGESCDLLLEFRNQLNLGDSFNIVSLLKIDDDKIERFIVQSRDILGSWVVDFKILENLSFQDKKLLLAFLQPEVHRYFQGNVLGHKGIEIIIDYLRNKSDPSLSKEDRITVCQDRNTFSKKLEELMQDPNVKDGYSHLFIVTKFDENPRGVTGHVTPVFMKKVDGEWEIIITDSTTDYSNVHEKKSSCAPLVSQITALENKSEKAFVVRKINISTFWRQVDDQSCWVIAIRDLVYFSQHGDEFLKQFSTSQQKINYFTDLPPELMKTIQLMRDLESYFKQAEKSKKSLEMATKKSETGKETLQQNLKRHTRKSPDGKRDWNMLVDDRSEKYHKIVIDKLIVQLHAIYARSF
ncbi:MAG: hypothetical protein V4494_04245 [Chlamydiota bacterium]